ncbi:MAG: PEGA domain-containing protein [Isosphaeraceae bacterium]|nr:PEGA domain-containing protein [Isosphaeraceae bacterium]
MVASGSPARWVVLVCGFSTCALSGCVERRYTIRSEPPGALVIVNSEEIGVTPVSRSFTYYGDRDVTLMKDGFATKRLVEPIRAPWWDNLLTEFFTENVVPVTLRDEREFKYVLEPATIPPQEELRQRGENLRSQGQVAPVPRRGGILGFLGF